MILDIILYVLAGFGGFIVLLFIWFMIEDYRGGSPGFDMNFHMPPGAITPESRSDEAFQYLDNEVRGQFRHDPWSRGKAHFGEPTLKGRVDMIEKHLGIEVVVKPATAHKLAVKKKGAK